MESAIRAPQIGDMVFVFCKDVQRQADCEMGAGADKHGPMFQACMKRFQN
jgi:hypothetical protein